jgi:hypothetical protein
MYSCMKISCTFCWHLGSQILSLMNTNEKKKSFLLLPFQNWLYSFQKNYIVYYLIKCISNITPNIDVCTIYPWKNLKSIALFNTFLLIILRWKLQLKQGFKLIKRIQKDICIISNLLLEFFNRLTWHHSSYNHIPIPYNHEITNIIKIYSPL